MLIPSLGVVPLVLLLAVLFGSLFGLGVAKHGWGFYRGNPALLAFLSLALLALAVPLGLQLWAKDHPAQEPIPGAVPLEFEVADPAPTGTELTGPGRKDPGADDRSIDVSLREQERSQDEVASTLVAVYEAGSTDRAWWKSEGRRSASLLTGLVRDHRADAVRIRDPCCAVARSRSAGRGTGTRRR